MEYHSSIKHSSHYQRGRSGMGGWGVKQINGVTYMVRDKNYIFCGEHATV